MGLLPNTVLSNVYFSSTSAGWSQAGAGHYAAANNFLDSLANRTYHSGQPATSVNFGPFGVTGMAAAFRQVCLCWALQHGFRQI
jgi:hypothetical protein